jgi:hypothetical protein
MKSKDLQERNLQGFNEELKKESRQVGMDSAQNYYDKKG